MITGVSLLLRQFLCGLRRGGHDRLRHFKDTEVGYVLKCTTCGHETSGFRWTHPVVAEKVVDKSGN